MSNAFLYSNMLLFAKSLNVTNVTPEGQVIRMLTLEFKTNLTTIRVNAQEE